MAPEHKAFQPDKPFLHVLGLRRHSRSTPGPQGVGRQIQEQIRRRVGRLPERTFERAKKLGWIPANTQLTPRHETMASWDSIPEAEKPFQRRLMEVCAGFSEHVDVQINRLFDELDSLGYGDNTLIFYIWGDNGSSAEGQDGTISELLAQNGIPSTIDQHIKALDELGGLDLLGSPKTDNMYHAGWGWAGSSPYKGTKLLASQFGGTRNPMPSPGQ